MAKMRLDADKIKSFFGLHIEKMVLAVILVLLVVFIYLGYSLEDLEQTPTELEQLTTTAVNKMNENTWDTIKEENRPATGRAELAKASDLATSDAAYATDKPLKPVGRNLGEKRKDPTLFPPAQLEVTVVSAPVAFRMKPDDVDLLKDAKAAELKKKEVKAPPKKPKRRGGYGSEMGGGSSSYGSEMSSSEPPSGMSGSSMYGMSMPGGESGMMGAVGGTLATGKRIPGFRPGMGAVAKPCNIAAVKAVIELQKQWDEYERVFSTAVGYNPARDVPRFVMFLAQRADVTDDPNRELTDADWKNVANNDSVRAELMRNPWYGFSQEIVDPRYLSKVLTMPTPPVMMRDSEPIARHSLTPRRTAAMQLAAQMAAKAKAKKESEADKEAPKVADAPTAPTPGMMGNSPYGAAMGSGSSMPPGYMGMPGMEGGSYSSEMGSSGMMGMMGSGGMGMYGSEMSSEGGSGMYGSEMGSEGSSGMYGSEMGSEGSSGMYGSSMGSGYGSGYGMMGTAPRGPSVEYALVRFYDFGVEMGRKYRYRISVFVEDPNHPQMLAAEPNERTLDDTVKARLAEVIKSEKEKETRIYYLRSEWSAPSEVVTIAPDPITLAGTVDSYRPTAVNPAATALAVPANEPKGSVMSVVWDAAYAVDAPATIDAYRGTVFNFKTKSTVIHPVTLQYKELDVDFATNRCVVDMQGGEELTTTDKEPLTSLGKYVILTASGDLLVKDELADYDEFQLHTPPEVDAPAATPYGGEMGMPGSEMGSEGSGSRPPGRRRGS
jgi:hypothetical protein